MSALYARRRTVFRFRTEDRTASYRSGRHHTRRESSSVESSEEMREFGTPPVRIQNMIGILDAAQRRFVVTLLAQLCPPKLVPSFFASRWKTPILSSEVVAALDPDQGALLGPDDSNLFRDERIKVKENPEDAEFANFNVQIRFLQWFVLDAKARNDQRLARELLREIREIVMLAKAAGAVGSGHDPVTAIEWIAEPQPSPKETDA